MQTKLKKITTLCMVSILAITATLPLHAQERDAASIQQVAAQSEQVSLAERPIQIQGNPKVIQQHQLITENQKFALYLKEDTLSLIVRDKTSGALMYSTLDEVDESSNETWQNFMQSGVVLEYIKGTNVNLYRADMLNANTQKQVTLTDTGFIAKISHTDIGISYEVHVNLEEDGFVVEVPQASIEEDIEEFKVAGFYLYPFLGYAKEGQRDGYMFIPDGSGALIYLEDNNGKFKQPFSKWIYGENIGIDENAVPSMFKGQAIVKASEYLLAPVFGMVHTDSQIGVLGIVEGGGEYSSKIEAYPNGAVTKYDWVTARFIYRQVYNQPTSKSSGMIATRQKEMNQFDARICYKFVTGDQANYTGLATAYREYLVEQGELAQTDYTYQTRVDFLGAEKENWLLFKKAVPMTTVSDVEEILTELTQSGVSDILSVYKGWQKDGVSGGVSPKAFKVDDSLGSAKELSDLIQSFESTGVDLYLQNDALRMDASKSNFMSYSTAKKLNKRIYIEETYKEVYKTYNYLVPTKTAEMLADIKKMFLQRGATNIMLSGISNTLFSHSERDGVKDRGHTAQTYEAIIKDYSENMNLILEQPFSYLWKYTSGMVDMPMKGSNYIFTDQEIPFLAIVLKGMIPMYSQYINFEANKEENFLNLVEQGVFPSFYITKEDPSKLLHTNSSHIYTSRFDLYKEEIIEYHNQLQALEGQVHGAQIIRHEKQGDVAIVEYSNGVSVYVNYGDTPAYTEGMEIPAKSYQVGGAK